LIPLTRQPRGGRARGLDVNRTFAVEFSKTGADGVGSTRDGDKKASDSRQRPPSDYIVADEVELGGS